MDCRCVCSPTGGHSLCDSCAWGRWEGTGENGQANCTGVLWTRRHQRGPGKRFQMKHFLIRVLECWTGIVHRSDGWMNKVMEASRPQIIFFFVFVVPPVRCCWRGSTWARISLSSPLWPCHCPWKAKPATESWPPACCPTCRARCCHKVKWPVPSTRSSKNCRTWYWTHRRLRR